VLRRNKSVASIKADAQKRAKNAIHSESNLHEKLLFYSPRVRLQVKEKADLQQLGNTRCMLSANLTQ